MRKAQIIAPRHDAEAFLTECRGSDWYAVDTGERIMTEEGPDAEAILLVEPKVHGDARGKGIGWVREPFRELKAAGLRIVNGTTFASRADVVVVAFHPNFDYDELREATQAALRGAFLIGSNRDATFPNSDGLWPGSGAIFLARAVMAKRARRAGSARMLVTEAIFVKASNIPRPA